MFALYALMGTDEQSAEMRKKYKAGGFGYGHAKSALLELLMDQFAAERVEFDRWMSDRSALDSELSKGAEKARQVGSVTLERVRKVLGY